MVGCAVLVREELEFLRNRQEEASCLVHMTERGELPIRVTHNDTKFNNILIDDTTGEALCVIDLDTVMSGIVAMDFGDTIRFAANTAQEDETDLSKVQLSLPLFEQFTRGFLEEVGNSLTENELDSLAYGAKIVTMEIGADF